MAGFELYAARATRDRRTWTAAIIVLGIVFMVVASIIPFIPFIIKQMSAVAANPELAKHPVRPTIGVIEMFLPTGLQIAFILLWVAVFERRVPAKIGFNDKAFPRFARGFGIGCAFLVTVVGGLWAVGVYQVDNWAVWARPDATAFLTVGGYALLFMLQGSSEETFMRGWLMGTVASRQGIVWAVVINSIVFGLLHLGNITPSPELFGGAANVALFGVFISLYAARERSIWGVCGWHAAWNWLLGVGFGLEVSGLKLKVTPLIVDLKDAPGQPWWLSGGSWGPEASVFTTVVLLVGIIVLIWKGALKPGNSYPAPVSGAPEQAFT